ncbi:MAG: lipoprotein [Frankiales bacterium]|nr:lipoprotein [Frankiales bacterium]
MRPVRAFRQAYGASPVHLLGLLLSFVVAFAAASRVYDVDPDSSWRYALWFVGAAILHDLVLFPAYAGLDRAVATAARRRGRSAGTVNYIRVPALLSGLLLLVFGASILHRGNAAFGAASGKDQEVFLGRWLIVTGVLFGTSAAVYAVRRLRASRTA